jgi:amino acid adenylation domain-containing protein
MQTSEMILDLLLTRGVKLWVQEGRLCYRAPAGALNEDALGNMRRHKAELIGLLERSGSPATNIPQRVARAPGYAAPLSHAQVRLWFLEQLGLVGTAYNVPVVFALNGLLDVGALRGALLELIGRHESLRTRFESIDGEVRQTVASAADFVLGVLNLSELPPDLRASEAQRLIAEEVRQPFDLVRGGAPFRATLLRLSEREHVLRMGMHHIISDGWSVGILVRDLAALYSARVRGVPASLPELRLQYSDYAQWQHEHLRGEALEVQLRYWKQQLDGVPEALELPTDRTRPAVPSFAGAEVKFELEAPLTRALKLLSKQAGATLYIVLLAALQILLWRWSGQRDVLVGSPMAGRTHRDLEDLIGFFVNTTPLRTRLEPGEDFRQLLHRVKKTALEAYAHQELPFDKLVAEFQPQRDLSRNPLFQVTFSFQTHPNSKTDFAGLTMGAVAAANPTAKFDLSLHVSQTGSQLLGAFEYATDIFDQATIERMVRQFTTLLEAIVADPQQPIAALPLLTQMEREQVLSLWSAAPTQHREERCLHELISEHARRAPQSVAVESDGEQLTYEQLIARSNQLAHHLRSLGVRAEVLVGLCVERSLEMVIGVLGILKAGGAYLPLDPGYPAERLAYMLADARVSILVTCQKLNRQRAPLTRCTVWLDGDASTIEAQPSYAPASDVGPDNLAYVIYTSGSTGQPKGVMVTHHNVLRLFASTRTAFDFGPHDVWTLFHSYAFDFSVWEIFGALLHGGKLVIVPFLISRSPQQFGDLLLRQRVTVLNQTPSAFRQLLRLLEEDRDALSSNSLRLVIFGGEALNVASLKPWFDTQAHERCALVNMYGITETTVHVTYRLLRIDDLCAGTASPIGKPIGDLRMYVLDENRNVVPPGLPGEIHVSGDGLARGYLHRPEMTAERFIPDPFGPAGGRMYRSGDVGRFNLDGEFEYLGRADHQVKLRGHRVELGEIEVAIARLDGVREVLVKIVDTDADNQRLVAWFTAIAGARIDLAQMRSELLERLPSFMVPAELIQIEAVPLTANGKRDFSRLPMPQFRTRQLTTAYMPPRNVVEERLAAIWEEGLGVERVGANDNFFALGGDSIRALQVVRAAAQRGIMVTAVDIFRHQTVAELAQAAGLRQAVSRVPPPTHVLSPCPGAAESFGEGVIDVYPLTAMQALMVRHYTDHQQHQSGIYHVQQCFRFRDELASAVAMRAAVELLVAAQPALRTVIATTAGGTLLQGILAVSAVDFKVVDLSAAAAPAQKQQIEAAMLEDRRHLFAADGRTPLLRFCWFQLAQNEFQLLMSIHHAIDDGWGNQHFLAQLFGAYRCARRGEPLSLPPADNVFKEFVAIEREMADAADARQFWASQQLIATGRACLTRRVGESPNRDGKNFIIEPELTQQLMALSRRLEVSLKAVLLSAYVELIAREFSIAAPTVGVVTNGRSDRLSDPLHALGLFWNFVPFCQPTSVGGVESIRPTQLSLLSIEPFAAYPLTQIEASRGVGELFFATFNFMNFHNATWMSAVTDLALLEVRGHDKFHFPLNCSFALVRGPGVIAVQVHYDAEYLRDSGIDRLAATLVEVLRTYVVSSCRPPTRGQVHRS